MYKNTDKTPIIIYGAGTWAKRLLVLLKISGQSDSVLGFAVTDEGSNASEWDGYPIRQYKKYSDDIKGCVIYIAVKGDKGQEIYDAIKDDGARDFVRLTEGWYEASDELIRNHFMQFPVDRNKVIFYCNNSKGFRCNCKYIALELMRTADGFELLWDVQGMAGNELPDGIKPVRRDTYDYYLGAYTSGVLVSNEGRDLGIKKRANQYFIMTWHGAGPFKKVGLDVPDYDDATKEKLVREFSQYDLCISCTDALDYEYRHAFAYEGEILHTGFPRNDIFFRDTGEIKRKVIHELKLREGNKFVLYAPTFRNIREYSATRYDLDITRVVETLEEKFGGSFQLMYRFHYSLSEVLGDSEVFRNGINVTDYPDMQELLAVSDVLITDYSSSMWDFSLQKRPVFLYHGDIELYMDDRGFYSSPDEWPYPIGKTSEELCARILSFEQDVYERELRSFQDKYKTYDDGHAAERVVERIQDVRRGFHG